MKNILTRRREICQSIHQYTSEFKKQFLFLGFTKFVLLLLSLFSPLLFKFFVDDVILGKKFNVLKWLCIGYLILYMTESLVLFFQKLVANKVYNKINFKIRNRIWKYYINSPATEYEKYSAGDLKNRIDTDTDAIEVFLSQHMIDYCYYWGIILCNTICFFVINWKMAILALLMVPISFWMTQQFGGGLKQTISHLRKIQGEYENWLQGCFNSWKEIKALVIYKNINRIFTRYWHEITNIRMAKIMYVYANKALVLVKDSFLTRMNLYFIGALLILAGELTVGGLLVFMKYYEQFFDAINNISNLDIDLSSSQPLIQRVTEILDKPLKETFRTCKVLDHIGKIRLEHVSFRYHEERENVLRNINLEIAPCDHMAIVGRSGCGKTTLIKVIAGLYEPQEGSITIDGVETNRIDLVALHKNIGVVMQDSILYNMTIKDNFLLAKASATDEEIDMACRLAHIYDFIAALPNGYQTEIGERGAKLSGGQRQRLAIARILLSSPKVVIFDESTSSLDYESESAINRAIEDISKERTVIIIAHRLSSVILADKVVVMNEGTIVSIGRHSELLGHCAVYDALFQKQFEGFEAS